MTERMAFDLLGRQFPRKDGIARVTGREIYTVDGNSAGVACRNAPAISSLGQGGPDDGADGI
jgi:hypothetical protein